MLVIHSAVLVVEPDCHFFLSSPSANSQIETSSSLSDCRFLLWAALSFVAQSKLSSSLVPRERERERARESWWIGIGKMGNWWKSRKRIKRRCLLQFDYQCPFLSSNSPSLFCCSCCCQFVFLLLMMNSRCSAALLCCWLVWLQIGWHWYWYWPIRPKWTFCRRFQCSIFPPFPNTYSPVSMCNRPSDERGSASHRRRPPRLAPDLARRRAEHLKEKKERIWKVRRGSVIK